MKSAHYHVFLESGTFLLFISEH